MSGWQSDRPTAPQTIAAGRPALLYTHTLSCTASDASTLIGKFETGAASAMGMTGFGLAGNVILSSSAVQVVPRMLRRAQ